MSKIYFRYGTMNSAKSLNLLATNHSYENTGRVTLLFKPAIDTRDENKISSRAGLSKEAILFSKDDNLVDLYIKHQGRQSKDEKAIFLNIVDALFIDEVQFCTEDQIMQLVKLSMEYKTPILCYGLRSDYTGNLFPAIAKLMVFADDIQEIKNICHCCNSKALMNLRIEDGAPVYSGESIKVGDIKEKETYYLPVCKKHYFNPDLKAKAKKKTMVMVGREMNA